MDCPTCVEDILNIKLDAEMLVSSGTILAFPLDVAGSDGYQGLQMLDYIQGLFLDAKQRGGNHYIVAAEDGPFDITAFA